MMNMTVRPATQMNSNRLYNTLNVMEKKVKNDYLRPWSGLKNMVDDATVEPTSIF